MQVTLTIEILPAQIAEVAAELGERNGCTFDHKSVAEFLKLFIENEAQSFALDPLTEIKRLQTSNLAHKLVACEELGIDENEYQRFLDEADYRSLAYSF